MNLNKILGLAGAVAVCTGLAYGQTQTCTASGTPAAGLIRVEGTTEQVADVTIACSGGTAATLNVLDILSLPVTSKLLSGSTSEAVAVVEVGGTPYAPSPLVQGVVSGSQITFSGISVPAAASTILITNVRVNASGLTVGTGTPPGVTESAFLSGVGIGTTTLSFGTVAYAFTGLSGVTTYKGATPSGSKGVNTFVICQATNKGTNNAGVLATLDFGENFATAFKAQGSAGNANNGTAGNEFIQNTETGYVPTVGFPSGGSNLANSSTEVQIVFSNVPANLALYVPVLVAADQAGGGTLTLISAATGGSPVSAATTSSTVTAGTAALTVSSGTATAYYSFGPGAASSTTVETFGVPVYSISSANTITASTTAITAAVSFAPIGAAAGTIPNFVVGPSTVTTTLSTFSGCTTSLLFPFVTNQLGFDTGIAIANTSSDPFGSKGATPQQGTCTMSFYGNGAPSPATITTPVVPTGTVYTTVLSSVAAGFQGYLIAQCNFQYAHGFGFVEDGVGPTGGLSQGYLAGVIPDVNQVGGRPANPSALAAAGTGETLGN